MIVLLVLSPLSVAYVLAVLLHIMITNVPNNSCMLFMILFGP
jgi:hypothetical protein